MFNCNECASNRIQNPPSCSCPEGTWDDEENQNATCQNCEFRCLTCLGAASACLRCKGNRVSQPECRCPDGFYEDGVSSLCPRCQLKCATCSGSSDQCLTCTGDRVLSDGDCLW